MEEYIDIVTKEGFSTGKSALKSEIHTKGHYHNTAHVWLYTNDGNILLAQRAASKTICPLLWDISVAGHVDAGETIEDAAIREVFEEIGLSLNKNQLQKIGVFECFQSYPNGIADNEFHHTFISELTIDIKELKIDKNEVESVKLVSLSEFENLIKNIGTDNHFVPSNKKYYQFILESIKEAIKIY
ncbi:MAG: NUDIX domain-containing protein [Flavobacteriaceae bacterium]|nr:NUDIX domain-containing protein [Flavobacteriaceae bacterium]